MKSRAPVTLLIVGAGDRGAGYAQFARKLPRRARVVGVAEPRAAHRERMAQDFHLPPGRVFQDWRAAADRPRMADAVIIATQDAMHVEPAEAFARKGYAMLLEKPMAPNPRDCRRIVAAVKAAGIPFAVCHVLRYTAYTRRLQKLLAAGAVGDIVSVQHLEPVGWWHQAHSFVRGNWRNERESSSMLLAKSCHDLDWLRAIVGRPCRRVSSFGSLYHFRPEQRPAGAAARCLDCAVEPRCPYSAKRIYMEFLRRGYHGWPLSVLTTDLTPSGVRAALATGPYGRCVYACDNDVVDHQVVNLVFDGGVTAAFTMTAFNEGGGRQTKIFGTRGEITGDSTYLTHFDFRSRRKTVIDTRMKDHSILGGHGGGDGGLMDAFLRSVAENDPRHISSGLDETLESHLIVFAAEESRRTGRIVPIRS